MNGNSIGKTLGIKEYSSEGVILAFVLLRFLATCLITNSHYQNVYPVSSIAIGGFMGNMLFFIVSAYVLTRPSRLGFIRWYIRRIKRIYPTIIIVVLLEICLSDGMLAGRNLFELFVFPTPYVFIAAMIVLYVPLYYVNKIEDRRKFVRCFLAFLALWVGIYICFLDKSEYEMVNTYCPIIVFPYFSGMLIGVYLRKFAKPECSLCKLTGLLCASVLLIGCNFVLTNWIRGNEMMYPWQIVVHIPLILALFALCYAVASLEPSFKKWPAWLLYPVNFIAGLTLEIYVVQFEIIARLSSLAGFPYNWVLVSVSIVVVACLLRLLVRLVTWELRPSFKCISGRKDSCTS